MVRNKNEVGIPWKKEKSTWTCKEILHDGVQLTVTENKQQDSG
jgi:hypothetical protein